ncbi:unnamed protein product, partial [Ectocarpus fasciculatus]
CGYRNQLWIFYTCVCVCVLCAAAVWEVWCVVGKEGCALFCHVNRGVGCYTATPTRTFAGYGLACCDIPRFCDTDVALRSCVGYASEWLSRVAAVRDANEIRRYAATEISVLVDSCVLQGAVWRRWWL